MFQQLFPFVLFLALLAALPFLIRKLKLRLPSAAKNGLQQNRIVSAVAVGPHQRVVTVEVGPDGQRVWLTLGVGNHGITCLHTAAAPEPADGLEAASTIPGPAV